MSLRFYQLPFILTLVAMPLNWLVGLTGVGVINWLPEFFALLAFTVLITTKDHEPSFKIPQLIIFLVFSVHLLYQVFSGQGVGGSAILSVILMVSLYLSFFKVAPVYKLNNKLINQVSFIYMIHVGFILVEFILLKTGNANILSALAGGHYKAAKIDAYTPIPQSLYKQSQAAAQLCLFAMTWFWMIYLSRKKLMSRFRVAHVFVLIVALLFLSVFPNTTVQFVGIVLLFSVVYLMPVSKKLFLRFVVLLTGSVLFIPIYKAITYKISKASYGRAEEYINAFMDPVYIFLEQPLFSQLWGVGGLSSASEVGLKYADFGLGVFVLQVGLILVVIACLVLLVLFLRAQLYGHRRLFNNPQCFPWVWLGLVNALLAVGNLLSLVHYTVALQTGGRALFSFHIAIAIFSLQQLVQYRRVLKMQVSEN